MGQYGIIKCPICYASIEWTEKYEIETCPACHEYIKEKLIHKGEGLTTAVSEGPGLKPVKDLKQDVY